MLRSSTVVTLIGLLTSVGVTAAYAQPGTTSPSGTNFGPEQGRQDAPSVESYRSSIIQVDSAVGGLMIAASVMFIPCLDSTFDNDASPACTALAITSLAGAGLFVVGSPIVHLSKGNSEGAAMALLLRAGLPAAGIVLGTRTDGDLGALAVVGGISAAMMIDWFALSKREVPSSATFIQTVAPVAGGANVGLAGSF